jgi:hypothetical protein
MTQVVGCDVGRCGILAVGGCAPCGAAFCPAHRVDNLGDVRRLDRCILCGGAKDAAANQNEDNEKQFLIDGKARWLPLNAPVPTITFHTVSDMSVRRRFRGSSIAKTNVSHGSGWLLGSFSWHYRIKDHDFDRQDLTVLLNSQEASVEGHVDRKLVRVVADPPRGGYYLLTNRCTFGSRWSDIVEQVRALASHAHFH